MSSLTPETGFAQGASGPAEVYDTSPAGLGLSPAYLAGGARATASGGTGGTIPTGIVLPFAGAVVPTDWVSCDGATYDGTTVTYAALYAAIGTTYGGTGISAFKVPDLRGRVAVGLGTNADVSTRGNNDGQAVADRRPKHRTTNGLGTSHTLTLPNHVHNITYGNGGFNLGNPGGTDQGLGTSATYGTSNPTTNPAITGSVALTGSIGSNVANDALDAPSYIVLLYIIKL